LTKNPKIPIIPKQLFSLTSGERPRSEDAMTGFIKSFAIFAGMALVPLGCGGEIYPPEGEVKNEELAESILPDPISVLTAKNNFANQFIPYTYLQKVVCDDANDENTCVDLEDNKLYDHCFVYYNVMCFEESDNPLGAIQLVCLRKCVVSQTGKHHGPI